MWVARGNIYCLTRVMLIVLRVFIRRFNVEVACLAEVVDGSLNIGLAEKRHFRMIIPLHPVDLVTFS